jgi:uncharacterized protein (DUF1697 family)
VTTWIALFRAINVGGHAKLAMADVRAMADDLGLIAPRTLLNSGNLVFGAQSDGASLQNRLAAATKERFGVGPEILVRSREDWRGIVAANPFQDVARTDPAHLLVMPLSGIPSAGAEAALRAAVVGREEVALVGQTVFLTYPDGIGRSKLTAALAERHLGVSGTGRNWTTVTKIAAMMA